MKSHQETCDEEARGESDVQSDSEPLAKDEDAPVAANESDGADAALRSELERLEKERSELEEQFLRLRAEFDNYRRRTRREAESLRAQATGELLTSFLPIVDNLERAVHSAKGADGASKTLVDGVDMVLKQFLYELEKVGVRPIEAVGATFDPNVHEAVVHEESAEQPDGHIIAELQKGYTIGDKVLRPSMVKVAKGSSL